MRTEESGLDLSTGMHLNAVLAAALRIRDGVVDTESGARRDGTSRRALGSVSLQNVEVKT